MILRLVHFFFVIGFLFDSELYAQNTFSQTIDSNHIVIGDPIQITQSCSKIPTTEEVIPQLKSLEWLQILSNSEWILTPKQNYERKIIFSVYDSGQYIIPELNVKIDSQIISTDSMFIRVFLPIDSTINLYPIKSILETKKSSKLIYIVIGSILLLSLIVFLLIVLFRADRIKIRPIHYLSQESPEEKAIRLLKELNEKNLHQQGFVQEYYDELSFILRSFFNEGLNLPALESSTSDLLKILESKPISLKGQTKLFQFLNLSDLIKFANKNIEVEQHRNWFNFAEEFIQSNKQLSNEILLYNKVDFSKFLGKEISEQFENPSESVPLKLIEIKASELTEEILLISNFVKRNSFVLPSDWVNLHKSKMGQLSIWQLNILSKYKGIQGSILLLFLLPVIAGFLPFMLVIGLFNKENVLQRGVFSLSKNNKLVINNINL